MRYVVKVGLVVDAQNEEEAKGIIRERARLNWPPVSRVEVYEAKEIPRPPTGSVEADAILYAYGGGIHGRDEDDIYRDTLAPDGR